MRHYWIVSAEWIDNDLALFALPQNGEQILVLLSSLKKGGKTRQDILHHALICMVI